ncbi:hypothetical protein [Streptomyces antarcticus]|uniref:hypothetical protein n=1 Tax=Streptomyces antarcticus TaxID=2996458 RepID=UPI00226D4D43|nr:MULTISPECIES: hypothetical protein [unclassified Streptomyces]MCY0947528.1 hypothetical protein [Streptomyces sp. H34-AA3]MCY0954986.1 hypothetical protein [Streptomyces sp. H27-S2]MCZ4087504.1 hypothetical protein [Streptomyces sp. H34-S5]
MAALPAGSGGGKSPVGTRLTVRYRADDPQVVARQSDVDGGAAAVGTAAAAVSALALLTVAALATLSRARQRARPARQDPAGTTP